MNPEQPCCTSGVACLHSFIGWIIAGMGFHVGWAIIAYLVSMVATALAK